MSVVNLHDALPIYSVDSPHSWVEGAQDDHKNTLSLVGMVLGQVWLYGERGRGWGGGKTDTGTTIINEGPRALSTLFLGMLWLLTRRGPPDHRGERRQLRSSNHTRTKYYQPHWSGGANLHTLGRWTDNQGQHVIGQQSVRRLKTSDGRTPGDNRRCWKWIDN